MPPSGFPHYAGLLVGGVRYDALEFSEAGLSLARLAIERGPLNALGRSDECAATLYLGGPGWEESYDVVLRFAARGSAHLGLAFVTLPPPARRRLSQPPSPPEELGSADGPDEGDPERARPASFTFARLVDAPGPIRRLILPASAGVLTHTLARSRDNGLSKASAVGLPPTGAAHLGTAAASEGRPLPAGTLFVYGVALFALLVLLLGVLFG